ERRPRDQELETPPKTAAVVADGPAAARQSRRWSTTWSQAATGSPWPAGQATRALARVLHLSGTAAVTDAWRPCPDGQRVCWVESESAGLASLMSRKNAGFESAVLGRFCCTWWPKKGFRKPRPRARTVVMV